MGLTCNIIIGSYQKYYKYWPIHSSSKTIVITVSFHWKQEIRLWKPISVNYAGRIKSDRTISHTKYYFVEWCFKPSTSAQ